MKGRGKRVGSSVKTGIQRESETPFFFLNVSGY